MTAASFSKTLTAAAVHTPTALGNQPRTKGGARKFSAIIDEAPVAKRALHAHTEDTAKTPFVYDVNALSSIRPDQVPRFFGALTDSDKQEDKELPMDSLVAMQDRVDPKKVESMRTRPAGGKKGLVVRMNGKNYIADGHHRLAADWMNGEETAQVKFKDLTEVSHAVKSLDVFKVCKVDESLGLAFGWAIVCKLDGKDYYDWNVDHVGKHKGKLVPEHITEDAMLKGAFKFAETDRPGNEQHAGPDVGTYYFLFPLTTEVAKAMGIQTSKTGLMCAYHAPREVLAKFASGEYTGFSIEGLRSAGGSVEHD